MTKQKQKQEAFMSIKKIYFTIFVTVLIVSSLDAQNHRYVNTLFPASVITNDVVYGSAPFLNSPYMNESSTSIQDLLMDIYQAQNDTLSSRPAIIFAHGGGFSTGNRNVDDMVAFCDSFARKGYVTITIDYRQGVEIADNGDLHYTRAAYRGLQDGRTAVRFLRANASEYGIDPNHIYWGGNSAGSFIGLNSIYMDSDERPGDAGQVNYSIGMIPYSGPDLGEIDLESHLEYSGRPNAVMACWGGVGDTLIINPDNDRAVFLIHGTSDQIVSFNSGAPFNLNNISAVYGSNSINTRLSSIGIPAFDIYFVPGQDHEFYGVDNGNWSNGTSGNAYWDTVVVKATDFFWQQHKPGASFNYEINNLAVDFTNMSSGASSWLWDFGDGNTSSLQNPTHTYSSQGTYLVELYIENSMQSWDVFKHEVIISPLGINRTVSYKFNVFPNPVNGQTTLYFDKPLQHATLQIYNVLGQLVFMKNDQNGDHLSFDFSDLKTGIYFVRVNSGGEITLAKLIRN